MWYGKPNNYMFKSYCYRNHKGLLSSVLFCTFQMIENCFWRELLDFPVIVHVLFIRKFSRKFSRNSILKIFWDLETHCAAIKKDVFQRLWMNWLIRSNFRRTYIWQESKKTEEIILYTKFILQPIRLSFYKIKKL